jgi:hypothetical protein
MATKKKDAWPFRVDDLQRVAQALALIQEAQDLLETACQQLSPVAGFCRAWEAVGKSRDQVHRTWYAVESRRQRAVAAACRGKIQTASEA